MKKEKETQQEFAPLDVRGMMRLLQYAMLGLGHALQDRQEAILLKKQFGDGAVDGDAWSFNPNRVRESGSIEAMMQKHDDLLTFAKQVQAMLDHVKEVDTDIWAKGVKEYFKSKEGKDSLKK